MQNSLKTSLPQIHGVGTPPDDPTLHLSVLAGVGRDEDIAERVQPSPPGRGPEKSAASPAAVGLRLSEFLCRSCCFLAILGQILEHLCACPLSKIQEFCAGDMAPVLHNSALVTTSCSSRVDMIVYILIISDETNIFQ